MLFNADLGVNHLEQLVVRLGETAEQPILWGVWDTLGQTILASGMLPDAQALTTLQERAAQRPLFVIVPSTSVTLKTVVLPKNANKKVLAAIGFMIEDDIAGDISEQHIALGPRQGDTQLIAVVAHAQMQLWQTWLTEAELTPKSMLPDCLALPLTSEAQAAILSLDEHVICRTGTWSGISGAATWVKPWLFSHFATTNTPTTVVAYTADTAQGLGAVAVTEPPLELPIQVMAQGVQDAQQNLGFNLLQGTYKVVQTASKHWQFWRIAAVMVGLAFLFGVTEKTLTLQDLKAQNASLKARIDADIKQGFPNLGAYRDARRSIARYVKARENSGAGASGLGMLANLSAAFAVSNITTQSLRFDQARGELRLQAVAKQFADLEKFKEAATQVGLSVEQGAINNNGGQVVGSLIIKG